MAGETDAPPKPARSAPDSAGSPQLLERTFAVLALFAGSRPQWTTTEISHECGLPLPTAHRIVVALDAYGYLVRDEASKRFRLGPAAIRLGRAAISANDLPTAAAALLPRLTEDTMETALLTVPTVDRASSVCLVRVESPHPLRLSVEPGRNLPLHAGANQKAILAFLPEAAQEAILTSPLQKYCRRTISNPKKLRAELKTVRKQGWAYSLEETNPGVWGVAMSLLDSDGHAVAAVGVAGPQVRLSPTMVRKSLEATKRVADELAASLGLVSSCAGDVVIPANLAVGPA